MIRPLIAHFRELDHKPQSLWDHLEETSSLSGQFAGEISLQEIGEALGIIHDLGKASKEFQDYIGSATGLIDTNEDGFADARSKKGKIDHSSAGAQYVYRKLGENGPEGQIAAQVLSLCIASHHSGLIDCLSPVGHNNFKDRIEKPEEKTHCEEALANLSNTQKIKIDRYFSRKIEKQLVEKLKSLNERNESKDTAMFQSGLLIRFLFSCLIDADRLSTADFESPGNEQFRNYGQYHPWGVLNQRLETKLKAFEKKDDKNMVDDIRNQVSQACFDFSTKPKGIYKLTVPTGGGKTLASLRFALNHAEYHNMERIFYILPFTSIIDQNADEVRKILEDRDEAGNYLDRIVLEHHSNLTPEEETHRQELLSQNWDAPLVFTTQVQFFEALFGAGTRGARRMHQLANSVIIFDEVQTVPIQCVHMFNMAIQFLVQGCGSSVVLCTATQPLLDKVEPQQRALKIDKEQHIITDETGLSEKLKRVQVWDARKAGGWDENEVGDLVEQELEKTGSVLAIVNTRKSARTLYQVISSRNVAPVYHLSTNMCPAHRLSVLRELKDKLSKGERVICVSTQLIEAGIDIDFGTVIRYLAGLDSIAQAAGRCNRNGKRKSGNVWILNPAHENLGELPEIVIGAENAQRVLNEFSNNSNIDLIGMDAMERYYQYYFFQQQPAMNYPVGPNSPAGRTDNLFNLLSVNNLSVEEYKRSNNGAFPPIPFRQSFQTAAKAFNMFNSLTWGVIIPYHSEGKEIVAELCSYPEIGKQYKLLKKAQRYSVNLFQGQFTDLGAKQAIHEVQKDSGIYYLEEQFYSEQLGWCDEIISGMQTLIL